MFPEFLEDDVDEVARRLLGCLLIRTIGGTRVVVRIVESEAYDQSDPASHAYHGVSERNKTLFGPAGRLYVYFTYGMHYCCNISAGIDGFGAGVLIRAAEPLEGVGLIERRRGRTGPDCVNGPAKLCRALDIDRRLDGHDLREAPLVLAEESLKTGETLGATPRIGISKAKECLRRYVIGENPYLSR